jgi:hypothetical protein
VGIAARRGLYSGLKGFLSMLTFRFVSAVLLSVCFAVSAGIAGDDASGPIHYGVDLSRPFTSYAMSAQDNEWSSSLVEKLKYTGEVVHFVRTSLPLQVDQSTVEGAVYRAVEKPNYFYVVNGDAVLKLDTKWAYNPGGRRFLNACTEIARVHRLPQPRWWRTVSFKLAGAKGNCDLERARLEQI